MRSSLRSFEKGSIFLVICISNVPAEGLVTLPGHCLYGSAVNESSNIAVRGTERVTSSDVRRFQVERANQSQNSVEDVYEICNCLP